MSTEKARYEGVVAVWTHRITVFGIHVRVSDEIPYWGGTMFPLSGRVDLFCIFNTFHTHNGISHARVQTPLLLA